MKKNLFLIKIQKIRSRGKFFARYAIAGYRNRIAINDYSRIAEGNPEERSYRARRPGIGEHEVRRYHVIVTISHGITFHASDRKRYLRSEDFRQ